MSIFNQCLVLVAMIFVVVMMFIDQTIVVFVILDLLKDLSLSVMVTQWIVNGYLFFFVVLFVLGGKFADVLGHRCVLTVGVIGFMLALVLCGVILIGGVGEAWFIGFCVVQGAFAVLLFLVVLAIVVRAFLISERGSALAAFFGIIGVLIVVGLLVGGYLTEWMWRAIFWINILVAIAALVLIVMAKFEDDCWLVQIDYRGAVFIIVVMGLVVLGLQQVGVWGWMSVWTIGSIVVGALLLVVFVVYELRQAELLICVRLFFQRAFVVDNAVLLLMSVVFVLFFFFASVYAQASLGYFVIEVGVLLLVFFGGFVIVAQLGGRIIDTRGVWLVVVFGSLVSAIGFYLWGVKFIGFSFGDQWYAIAIVGVGFGLVLGLVSIDALNRASGVGYGEVIGIIQMVRNLGASLGLAIMGSMFVGAQVGSVEVANSTQIVAWVMVGIMVVVLVVAKVMMVQGCVDEVETAMSAFVVVGFQGVSGGVLDFCFTRMVFGLFF